MNDVYDREQYIKLELRQRAEYQEKWEAQVDAEFLALRQRVYGLGPHVDDRMFNHRISQEEMQRRLDAMPLEKFEDGELEAKERLAMKEGMCKHFYGSCLANFVCSVCGIELSGILLLVLFCTNH